MIQKHQLVKHLTGGEAFMSLDHKLRKISKEYLNIRPKDLPYSFYELFYHIYFTQRDILNYCLRKDYHAPSWPEDYWPAVNSGINQEKWESLQNEFFADREKLKNLILAEDVDLTDPVPSNEKHSILREILLVIEHTSYHLSLIHISEPTRPY